MLPCIVVIYNSWMYVIHIDSAVVQHRKFGELYQEQQRDRMNKRYVCSNILGSTLCCRIMFNNIAIKLQGNKKVDKKRISNFRFEFLFFSFHKKKQRSDVKFKHGKSMKTIEIGLGRKRRY